MWTSTDLSRKKIVAKQLSRFHLIPVIIRKISKITEQIVERTLGEREPSFTFDEIANWYSHSGNQLDILEKSKSAVWPDPAIPLLAISPKGLSKPWVLWADNLYLQDRPHWGYLNPLPWSSVYNIFVFFFCLYVIAHLFQLYVITLPPIQIHKISLKFSDFSIRKQKLQDPKFSVCSCLPFLHSINTCIEISWTIVQGWTKYNDWNIELWDTVIMDESRKQLPSLKFK